MISVDETIGIVGGGQLGRMMVHAASKMGYQTIVYCDTPGSPAFHVANQAICAPYDDESAMQRLAEQCAVITFEFENIPAKTIHFLEDKTCVRPGREALHISQNRLREKDFFRSLGFSTANYEPIIDFHSFVDAVKAIGTPSILKTTELGYDGKGQFQITEDSNLEEVWKDFHSKEGILESWVPFKMEISVVAARGVSGEFRAFVPVQNVHKNGILDQTIAPAKISEKLAEQATQITEALMNALEYIGTLAIEFFVTEKDQLLINEMAPRPHNSGHWTIDACCTDQFEQHIRAICGHPLGDPSYHSRAVMKNLVGMDVNHWDQYLSQPATKLHLYGKSECKPGRKMGHITELY